MRVFHWNLSGHKSPPISRTFLIILTDFRVIWYGLSRFFLWFPVPPVSFSSLWKLLWISSSLWFITTFLVSNEVKEFFQFFVFILLTLLFAGTTKFIKQGVLFLSLNNTMYGPLSRVGWFVCILNFQRILLISFSHTDSGLCIYYLSVCIITSGSPPHQSCQFLLL